MNEERRRREEQTASGMIVPLLYVLLKGWRVYEGRRVRWKMLNSEAGWTEVGSRPQLLRGETERREFEVHSLRDSVPSLSKLA